ncbi:hypothetical protein ACGGZK_03055 [Agromyces sp. MMS24-K17]|uniref:hypothetical protein n=1 Tax=Agromyces sp. MMS24-K17 TaxID=3372850 RepID=UPI00375489C2
MARRARVAMLTMTAALGLGLALAGCSSGGSADDTAPATTAGALPPVIVDLGEVDGTTVEVPLGGTIDLTGDDETFTAWEADIADPAIVEFTPGKDDGSAQFNPGLTALEVGSTDVTLHNAETDDSVSFTVEVTDG